MICHEGLLVMKKGILIISCFEVLNYCLFQVNSQGKHKTCTLALGRSYIIISKMFAKNQNYLLQFYIIYCEKCFMWFGLSLFLILYLLFLFFILSSLPPFLILSPTLPFFIFFFFLFKLKKIC